jgi:DNA polymerase-3 subunit gamma/tau
MDAFVVSALKYRPTSFEEVVGQQGITQTLKNSLEKNQLAQALLFCGPRGVGKTSCARILAKEINKSDFEGTLQDDFAFNIFELDAASNNSVEDIRKINEQVRIPPQVGSHKIYIIDEAHMLSNAAFNAFLKTLEEPPKHIIFILATTEKNKIIPTVLSRCQVYDFKRIAVNDIQEYLVTIAQDRNLQFEENALYLIAQKADGALRDALSIFDRMVSFTKGNLTAKAVADNLNLLDHQTYLELGKIIFKNDIHGILKRYDELLQRGIEPLQFIKGLGDFFRHLILAKDPSTLTLMELGVDVKRSFQQETKILSTEYLLDGITLINSFEVNYKSVSNKRVHIELSLMQLASLHFNGEKKKKKFIISAQEANKLNHKNQYNSTIRKNYAPEKSVQEKKNYRKSC